MDFFAIEESLLAERGIIVLSGWIDEEMFAKVANSFLFLESIGSPDIIIKINSLGGDMFHGKNICSLFEEYEGEIRGVAIQYCSSAAFFILQKCDIRVAHQGTEMIPHFPAFDPHIYERYTSSVYAKIVRGDKKILKEMKKRMKALAVDDEEIVDFLTSKSNLSSKKVRKLLEKDEPLPVKKAYEYGFIDQVIPYFN